MFKKRDWERFGGRVKDAAAVLVGNRRSVCLDVPHLIQVDGQSCGFCSALMVAKFYSIPIPQTRIQRFAHASRDGTSTRQMVEFLRGTRLSVRVHEDGTARVTTLLEALDRNIPVIVSVRPKEPHYAVMIGYDSRFFYLNDPSPLRNISGRILRSRFRRMWIREALVVTKRIRARKRRQHHSQRRRTVRTQRR